MPKESIENHIIPLPIKIAVLLTCFNRKEKTKFCLQNLFSQEFPEELKIHVFLCNDGSTDGTEEMLKEEFPLVNVCKGDGQLFWGGGMRKAWEFAMATTTFNFYLWLNDDTYLLPGAIKNLWKDYQNIGKSNILTTACKIPGSTIFSYGGYNKSKCIFPNGKPQRVSYINGNVVLIPNEVVENIGILSPIYKHYFGDYDYGLRAQKAGFPCYTTSDYYAECEQNKTTYWANPELPLKERWKWMKSYKGLSINEYVYFNNYHFGNWKGFNLKIKLYIRVISPILYFKLRNSFTKIKNMINYKFSKKIF